MDFTDEQVERYARHILLPQVGGAGQQKLLQAKVLVVGAGGLGSPLMLYLAAAGVGTIGIIDDDVVELSNLQRQIAHKTSSIGHAKIKSAASAIGDVNPDINVIQHNARINVENVMDVIAGYDIIADGSDNFPTRFLLNDACYFAKKILVSGAILRFDGQVATFKNYSGTMDDNKNANCYRCIFPTPPPPGEVPSCAEAGVLGALCGTIGSLQATEVLKEILGIGQSMSGHLLVYDALSTTFRNITVKRDPACPLCGDTPSIHDLSIHSIHSSDG